MINRIEEGGGGRGGGEGQEERKMTLQRRFLCGVLNPTAL